MIFSINLAYCFFWLDFLSVRFIKYVYKIRIVRSTFVPLLSYFVITVFTLTLISNAPVSATAIESANDPLQISNDEVNNSYLQYVKLKIGLGQGNSDSKCNPDAGNLDSNDLLGDNALCNPGLENLKDKSTNGELDQNIIIKLSNNDAEKTNVLKDKFEKLRERMEKAISEEEESIPLPDNIQKLIEQKDIKTMEEHKSKTGENCRNGDVLSGASNEKDLKVLAECQDAIGDVMHTKKMDDGDYKFLLKLENKYDFLINDKNDEKTDGLLVVEVVPKDQDLKTVDLPKEGDKVHIWGAWVTDKPKGWHEIHPTWQVVKD